jgi:acetylornithine deacetylase/succinyl-diaminopimelate desuccinylase-like protein
MCCGKAAFIMSIEQTLADLVAFDSVSSRSNAEIITYLKTRCEARGLNTRTYSHADETVLRNSI